MYISLIYIYFYTISRECFELQNYKLPCQGRVPAVCPCQLTKLQIISKQIFLAFFWWKELLTFGTPSINSVKAFIFKLQRLNFLPVLELKYKRKYSRTNITTQIYITTQMSIRKHVCINNFIATKRPAGFLEKIAFSLMECYLFL